MKLLYVDIETRSRTDLKKLGVYRYTEDPDFSILMAAWSEDGAGVKVALGHDEILAIPGLLDPAVTKVAHNAQFERVALGTLAESLLEPEQWLDTQALAAEYGYPVSLEACAKALKCTPKDEAGTKLIKLFTQPNRDGSWNDATTHPMEWLDFIAYCEQDVETLIEVHQALGDWPTPMERRVWCADQRINDRGMRIDLELCRIAADEVAGNKVADKEAFTELTGVDNPGSVQQVTRWFKEQGVEIPNLQAATVQAMIDNEETDPLHRRVLELRQDLALAAGGKFSAALDVVSPDCRIRGGFRFFGAHTGRWSGQRVQPQNLPRLSFDTVEEEETAIWDLMNGFGASPTSLKKLVRSMFIGPLAVVDYSAIEARVVAWIAQEEWVLQAFRDGRDIYVETANRMGGLTRFQGKVAVLALGYNGGVNSLRAMSGAGTYYNPMTGKPVTAGTIGGAVKGGMGVLNLLNQAEQEAVLQADTRKGREELIDKALLRHVRAWRRANPRIVKLWELMQDAVDTGGRVGPHIKITRRGDTMKMHLPSGRAICYHGMRWERYKVTDEKTGRKIVKEGYRYNDPKRGGARIGTYGGRLTENATQAIARDVLAEALVRLDDAGYPVVGHVHDEILVESTELEEITRIMTQVPRWGRGLPLDGEGFVCDRYRKG